MGRSSRTALVAMMASALLVVIGGYLSSVPERGPGVTVDLLGQDWRDVAGLKSEGHRLHVTATDRTIVDQNGAGGQPNPPVNLAGTHLMVAGDFALSAALAGATTDAGATADASWTVYDRPPVIADEFRMEPAALRLTLQGDRLEIAVFDGAQTKGVRRPVPVHDEHRTVRDPGAALTVSRSGDTLSIASGLETLSSMPFGRVFSSGALWLGFTCSTGSFDVTSLKATAPDGSGLRTAGVAAAAEQPSVRGLQALAADVRPGFRIGAAVALGPLASDQDYARELVGNFGAITLENAMKPQFLSPKQGVYTFEEADAIIAIANSKGMAVHGHTIAFSEAMPLWMRNLPTGTAVQRRSSATALLDYIATVVGHFRGQLDSLDVVNEPFDVDQGTSLQQNVWYRVFGPGYPAVVSRAVYQVDPNVKQYVNENGADVPGTRQDALLKLVLDTNTHGGHIYGVGLQAHVYDFRTDAISGDDLSQTLGHFAGAGLHVRISENDVTDGRGVDAQATEYAMVLGACLRSAACVSYTTWGVDDRYDWWIDANDELRQGHDHLFDGGHATAAYFALSRVLSK